MNVGDRVYIKKNCKEGHYYSGEIGIVTLRGDSAGESDLLYVQLQDMVNTPSHRSRIFKKMGMRERYPGMNTTVIKRQFWFHENQVHALPEKSS